MRLNRVMAITAAAVIAMTFGQVASSAPAGEPGPANGNLRSICEFPKAGPQPVTAGITATFPASVPAGSPVRGTDVTTRLVLPEQTVAALRAAGASAVEGIANLELNAGAAITLAGLEIAAQPLPETGELRIERPGDLEPVPTKDPGDLTISLGAPRLNLVLRTEDGSPITDEPAALAPCTVDSGQDPALTTVRVLAPEPPEPTDPTTTRPAPPLTGLPSTAPDLPTDIGAPSDLPIEPRRESETRADDPPNPCGTSIPPDARQSKNGYFDVAVKTTVKKLGADIVFGPPGYLGGKVWLWVRPNPNDPRRPYFCNGLRGDLWLPPTRGSFTILRFVPTTAVVTVVPVGPAEGVVHPITFRFTGKAVTDMVLSDVTVGGTAFDVGPACRTTVPIVIELQAEQRKFDLANGGVLEADFTIPPFAGCGVDDPLDSLFTNLVSGPDNHIRIDVSRIKECPRTDPRPPVCAT